MGYKMKGFSGFGNSPLKGKGDNLKRIMTENKIAQKKAGTWYAKGADPTKKPTSTGYKPHKVGTFNGRDVTFTKHKRIEKPLSARGKAQEKAIKKFAGKATRVASKIAAPLGVAATLYDFYKSGQEHSGGKAVKSQKSFMEDAKKKTKSIWNNKK